MISTTSFSRGPTYFERGNIQDSGTDSNAIGENFDVIPSAPKDINESVRNLEASTRRLKILIEKLRNTKIVLDPEEGIQEEGKQIEKLRNTKIVLDPEEEKQTGKPLFTRDNKPKEKIRAEFLRRKEQREQAINKRRGFDLSELPSS